MSRPIFTPVMPPTRHCTRKSTARTLKSSTAAGTVGYGSRMVLAAHKSRPPLLVETWCSDGPSIPRHRLLHRTLMQTSTNICTTISRISLQQACETQHILAGSAQEQQLPLARQLPQQPPLPQQLPALLPRLRARRLTITLSPVLVLVAYLSLRNSPRLARRSFWSKRVPHLLAAGAVPRSLSGSMALISPALMSRASATRFGSTQKALRAGMPHRWLAVYWAEALRSTQAFGGSLTQRISTRTSPAAGGPVT